MVVDADGNELSEPAFSPEFDTDRTVPARITSAVPQIDGSVRFWWVPGAYIDSNPGDPLDLPAEDPSRYQPVVTQPVSPERARRPSCCAAATWPPVRTPSGRPRTGL
uniref:hypothetical protein n=1 Tax=Paractinoplanes polyasparticus TaxID=2856853 RepID=UPI001C84F532|nr:hypothetical protein [Actinoplanes polyasparticus]